MFTGIIKNTGKLKIITKRKNEYLIEVVSNLKFHKNEIGSSISCSGVCLTLTKFRNKSLFFYLSKETLKKSNFEYMNKGKTINLEKSLKYGDRISGHFVQGHVDTVAKIVKIFSIGKSWYFRFKINKKYNKYLTYKGSIAINGVSLTIGKIMKKYFQIVTIPHTLKLTNLIKLKEGDFVNVEFDILNKYIKKI